MFQFKNDSPSKTSNPRVFSATFDQIFLSAWKNSRFFYSKFYSTLYIRWLCWRKRNRRFSKFDYAYITICFIGSTKPIFVLNHFINRKFYNCHFLVAKHLFDRKNTRKHILTNRVTSCNSFLLLSGLSRPSHLFGK